LRRYPGDFWLNCELAFDCANTQPPQFGEAIRYYTAALALRPDSAMARSNLLGALAEQGKLAEAEALYREAVRLRPGSAGLLLNGLVPVLRKQRKLAEAEAPVPRSAPALAERLPWFTFISATIFTDQGKLSDAEAEFSCRPPSASSRTTRWPHTNLAFVLLGQGKVPEAEAECREALATPV